MAAEQLGLRLTLLASDLNDLRTWVPRVTRALSELPELTSIDANDGEGAQQISLKIDRDAASAWAST